MVLLDRHRFFQRAIAWNQSGGNLSFELQSPDYLSPRHIKRRCQPATAIFGPHTHIRSVEPGAIRLVRRQPAALDDVGEPVVHVVESKLNRSVAVAPTARHPPAWGNRYAATLQAEGRARGELA